MSRYHWWGFIVNEAGEPIENAEITVKLAGGDILANVYYDEFGEANSTNNPFLEDAPPPPQLSTLSNGYYEFWIGDITEQHGYYNDQKFKIEWQRIGVAHGLIDYINVFPLGPQTESISLGNCAAGEISREYNKLISDYLGCKWDTHVDSNIILPDGSFNGDIHGLDVVEVTERDRVENKILTNYLGNHWETHRSSSVQDPAADVTGMLYGGYPHNIREYNENEGSDTVRNRLVSNADMTSIDTAMDTLEDVVSIGDNYLQNQINNLTDVTNSSKSGWWEIYGTEWIYMVWDKWYVDIHHDLMIYYPLVQVYEISPHGEPAGKMLTVETIEIVDTNTVRIVIVNENKPDDPDTKCIVRIANGGIHRHPVNEEIGGGINDPQDLPQ